MKIEQIYDNYNRPIQYLRLAVTDRCNLRCFYCMPEHMQFVSKKELLSYEEMERLASILAPMGVSKIRITGGEPFVRRELLPFLNRLSKIDGIDQLNITTNGVLTWKYMKQLKDIGIHTMNLSLDTIDKHRFFEITRRDTLDDVLRTLHSALEYDIRLKINAVVMDGKNTSDILPMAELARKYPLDVRFIEEMPFNGKGSNHDVLKWDHKKIIQTIKDCYPAMKRVQDGPSSTSTNYQIPGFKGLVGVIPAFSRTFCGQCNRIRVTALGMLKTCLYDDGVFDLKRMMRNEKDDGRIRQQLIKLFKARTKDGFEAEQNRAFDKPLKESMSTIGG